MFDHVIVGAGSAGWVLAARQSEDPPVKVALIEAGGKDDAPEIHTPITFPPASETISLYNATACDAAQPDRMGELKRGQAGT